MTQTLKISQIEVAENPRKDFSGVDELAKSIGDCGLLQPIAVRPSGSGKYILVDGEQRLRAFKKLKREEIPVYVLNELDTQEAKEAQLTANLMRSDLSLIERMRGFAALLVNAPAKYNTLVIANKFGLKEKEVKAMVGMAGKLDPAVDAELSSGRFDEDAFDELAKLQREYQLQVAKFAKDGNVEWAIRRTAYELHFDDVFNKEKARAAGKLHYDAGYCCYTFDKEYAAKVQAEFEARTKKNYAQEKAKGQGEAKKLTTKQIEKKKANRLQQKAKLEGLLYEMRQILPKFLAKPASVEVMKTLCKNAIEGRSPYGLSADDCKLLLKGWGIEFKASELSTSDLRELVGNKILAPHLAGEKEVVNLYEFVTMEHGFTTLEDQSGFKTWINRMEKALK